MLRALILLSIPFLPLVALGQTVIPTVDPAETPGARPYEMAWAKRTEPAPPTVRFDDLTGWTVRVEGGAEATVRPSRAQNAWDRPVARIRYRGAGREQASARITLVPPRPIALPDGADSVDVWLHGNRWDYANDAGTPPVTLTLLLEGAGGQGRTVTVDTVRWEEWWLMHRRVPDLKGPATLEGIVFTGGWQTDWRELFLDSVRFYKEALPPLSFAPRPRRNLTLPAGQTAGANTGAGRLPFPTREETILPATVTGPCRTDAARDGAGYRFASRWAGGTLAYRFDPVKGLAGLAAELDGKPVGILMAGGGIRLADGKAAGKLASAGLAGGVVTARYDDGTTLAVRLLNKSLVVDVRNETGSATEVGFGELTGLTTPRAIWNPYMTFGGSNPSVLMSRAGDRTVFTSLWVDWYRSNGSELYGAESVGNGTARINGGVRYQPRTDGRRNPLFERLFVTVSPTYEEVLPSIANPVGLHSSSAADKLWQETWGPADYAAEKARGEKLRAYGIEKLIQCNHEIEWRDGGESFTVRLHAAPKRGGDEGLQSFVAHQKGLGWLSGLYTNYTDFAPVNEHWDPDFVQRQPEGDWRSAWARCWALKPLRAVELEAALAPQLKARYGTDTGYTDVHTAVAPWGYNDYDARVPGAGTFAQTFYAYGELLRNDSRVFAGPIFSEGTYQWLYAGLTDGNYGLCYNGRPLANEPLLPIFDLYQIHPRECDIGMAWTGYFCDAIPNWTAPGNIDRAIDRFLLHTLAYGHIGWLVEEQHGIERTCRSYYMLQQVQARYGLKAPARVAYWDGTRLRSVSEALALDLPRTRRQLYVEYPGGLRLWLNDHPAEDWSVRVGDQHVTLPPAGWAAFQPPSKGDTAGLFSYSGRAGGGRADYLRSAAYVYLDGRGSWFDAPEGGSTGGLAITRTGAASLRAIRVGGAGTFAVARPFGVAGPLVECRAYDVAGKELAKPVCRDGGARTWIEPVEGAVRYELRFAGRTAWSLAPAESAVPPGGAVPLLLTGAMGAHVTANGGEVSGGRLAVPPSAKPGDVVVVRAERSGQSREAVVRVAAPVTWAWRARPGTGGTRLTLLPTWTLGGLRQPVTVRLSAADGWRVAPSSFTVDPLKPPASLAAAVTSALPAGAEGALTIALVGFDTVPPTTLKLRRAPEAGVVADLRNEAPAAWGIARRGQTETPVAEGSGGVCHLDASMPVGGVTRGGWFMHPPYMGGTGYTWAELRPLALPAAPCQFRAQIGLRDGGDPSDGVVYRVYVEDGGAWKLLAEKTGVQRSWQPLTADLSAYAGKTVRLRLVADCGPKDNSTADWACWGEPEVALERPGVVTLVE